MGKFSLKNWSSPNWLKLGTSVHSYMLISNLIFTFSKFLSFIFFGQIWSQNLKFSKLTEIWYRGTLLYAYYDFNVYFFKMFVIHIFGLIWSQNPKSPDKLKFGTGIYCYMLITILVLIFSKILSLIFFWANLVSKSEVFQID